MKIGLDAGSQEFNTPPRLWLYAESKSDSAILHTIEANYEITNFGRNPKSGRVEHVAIALTPKTAWPGK